MNKETCYCILPKVEEGNICSNCGKEVELESSVDENMESRTDPIKEEVGVE